MNGKVQLPTIKKPPMLLEKLIKNQHPLSSHFMKYIRQYNNMFSFTSMGGRIDKTINNGNAPYIFRLNGENRHLIGSLLPMEGQAPKFAQLYIFDSKDEIADRMAFAR